MGIMMPRGVMTCARLWAGSLLRRRKVSANERCREAVRLVVGELFVAAPFGLLDCALQGARDPVCIENRRAVEVARGAADGLDQRTLRTQNAFLVSVEDRDQRHFW